MRWRDGRPREGNSGWREDVRLFFFFLNCLIEVVEVDVNNANEAIGQRPSKMDSVLSRVLLPTSAAA